MRRATLGDWIAFAVGVGILAGIACYSIAHGAPRPLPKPKPAPPRCVSAKALAGTSWAYKWTDGSTWVFVFLPDGRFLDQTREGFLCWRDTWTYSESNIYLTCDGSYEGLHLQIALDSNEWKTTLPGTLWHWRNLEAPRSTDGRLTRCKAPPRPAVMPKPTPPGAMPGARP